MEDILEGYKTRSSDLSLEMEREYFHGELKDGFFIEAGAAGGKTCVSITYSDLTLLEVRPVLV